MSSSETLRLGTTPSRSSVTRSSYWHPCLSKSRPNNNSKRPPPPAPLVVNGARDNTGKAAKHTPGVENQDSDNNGSKGKDNKAHDESREDNDDWEKLSNSCDTLCAWDGSDEEEEREDRRGEQAEWDQDQQTFQSVAGQGLWSDPIDNSLWRENRIQDRDERLVALWKAYFGAGTMKDWQRLMTDLGFVGEFTSKTQCRKALRSVWVNIPQFLEAESKPQDVLIFASERRLAYYTQRTGRIFPNIDIPPGSPLRKLLSHVGRYSSRLRASGGGRRGMVA